MAWCHIACSRVRRRNVLHFGIDACVAVALGKHGLGNGKFEFSFNLGIAVMGSVNSKGHDRTPEGVSSRGTYRFNNDEPRTEGLCTRLLICSECRFDI